MTNSIRRPLSDGTLTRWKNPTAQPCKLSFHRKHGIPGNEQRNIPAIPAVVDVVVVEPGETVELPSTDDQAVQQTRCVQCSDATSLKCKDPTHPREVIGGQGIRLVRVDGAQPRLARAFAEDLVERERYEREERNRRATEAEAAARAARGETP